MRHKKFACKLWFSAQSEHLFRFFQKSPVRPNVSVVTVAPLRCFKSDFLHPVKRKSAKSWKRNLEESKTISSASPDLKPDSCSERGPLIGCWKDRKRSEKIREEINKQEIISFNRDASKTLLFSSNRRAALNLEDLSKVWNFEKTFKSKPCEQARIVCADKIVCSELEFNNFELNSRPIVYDQCRQLAANNFIWLWSSLTRLFNQASLSGRRFDHLQWPTFRLHDFHRLIQF